MLFLKLLLKLMTAMLYGIFIVIILYFPITNLLESIGLFPVVELLEYLAQKGYSVHFDANPAIEDSLLPCLLFSIMYALTMWIRRRIDSTISPEKETRLLDSK